MQGIIRALQSLQRGSLRLLLPSSTPPRRNKHAACSSSQFVPVICVSLRTEKGSRTASPSSRIARHEASPGRNRGRSRVPNPAIRLEPARRRLLPRDATLLDISQQIDCISACSPPAHAHPPFPPEAALCSVFLATRDSSSPVIHMHLYGTTSFSAREPSLRSPCPKIRRHCRQLSPSHPDPSRRSLSLPLMCVCFFFLIKSSGKTYARQQRHNPGPARAGRGG